MVDFSIIIGGEAGFGIMTTGAIFSRIASQLGYHVFDYVEYPSLIRGGHNAYEARIAEEEVGTLCPTVDFLVCLNGNTYAKHKNKLHPESVIIYDSEEFAINENYQKISIPFKKILQELKGQAVMKNTIAIGAVLATIGTDLSLLNTILEKQFSKKGDEVVNFNKKFAEMGFNHVKTNYASLVRNLLVSRPAETKLVISGNEAFSLGSIIADCRLYAAYPMTPASTVLTTMAGWQEKTGIIVRHSEDEIAAINTVIGASFAGVRASTGTSGGGFALMVESVSLAGVTEMPVVIFIASRPGPATGMPTWTEQGDLLFAVHAGHGEFPKIVLAPGDVGEMLELTTKAYNLADIYQLPVIILSDMYLSESHRTLTKSFLDSLIAGYKIERGKTIESVQGSKYLRYQITDDGVSPRLIPGEPGVFYQANSYEHQEDGHTTEDARSRVDQVNKRNRKIETYFKNNFQPPTVFGDLNKSDTIFIGWGSTKWAILEGQKQLKEQGKQTAFIHFTHVYPLSKKLVQPFFPKDKRYVLVENNSQGQFGKLLRAETGICIDEQVLRYDGRMVMPEEIVMRVNVLKNSRV